MKVSAEDNYVQETKTPTVSAEENYQAHTGIGPEPSQPITEKERPSLVKSLASNFYGGMLDASSSFNKMIGLGAFKGARDIFVTPGEKKSKAISEDTKSDNPVMQFSNDFSRGVGNMLTELPNQIMLGIAGKVAIAGKLAPEIGAYLSKIPDFAIGMGIEKGVQSAEHGKEPVVPALEATAVGTLYGSIGGEGKPGELVAEAIKRHLMGIPKLSSIGMAEAVYNAAKEGRKPTREEIIQGGATGAAYGTIFAVLPDLKARSDIETGKRIDSLKQTIQKVMDDHHSVSGNSEINDLIKSGDIEVAEGGELRAITDKGMERLERPIEVDGTEAVKKEVQDLLSDPKVDADTKRNINSIVTSDKAKENFIDTDVRPTLGKIKEAGVALRNGAVGLIKGVQNIFNPATEVIKKFGGEAYAWVIRAIHTPEADIIGFNNTRSAVFDNNFASIEKFFSKFSDKDLQDFNLTRGEADTAEAQQIQADAKKRLKESLGGEDIYKAVKEASDYVYNYAKENGIDLNYFEDYFFGAYKNDAGQVQNFLDYWRSTERFTKEKAFPTIADAEAYGLQLKDQNPITNIKKEMHLVAQRVGLKKLREKIEKEGSEYAIDTTPKKEEASKEEKPVKEKKAKARKGSKTWIQIVRKVGGISGSSIEAAGYTKQDFKEWGLGSLFKGKNKYGKSQGVQLDVYADGLVESGELVPKENESPAEALVRTLKEHGKEVLASIQEETRDYDAEYAQRTADLKARGYTDAEIHGAESELAADIDKESRSEFEKERSGDRLDSELKDKIRNWRQINDPVFKGMLFAPEYARFVNSLISTNKISSNLFLKGLRQLSFAARQIKFFGSMFHMANMAKASISEEGLFSKKGYESIGKSFKTLDEIDPEYKDYVNLGGGHGYSLDVEAQKQIDVAMDKISKGNFLGGLLRFPAGMAEQKWIPASPGMVKWMFNDFIPALKFERFKEMVGEIEDSKGRPATDAEKIETLKTIQNFYGEMNERLFGRSATVTSALRLIFSAPGYGEGNFRTIAKSLEEIYGAAKTRTLTPEGLRNVRFIASSLFTTLVTASVGTMIMTGKPPAIPKDSNEVRDLFKIKTNIKDGNGDTVFYDLMTYDKDYWSVYGNIATGKAGNIPGELTKRVSGMTGSSFRMLNDMTTIVNGGMVYDFKGQPVYYKTDDLGSKVKKFIQYEGVAAQPISLGTLDQSREKGVNWLPAGLAAIAGVRPTSSESVKEMKQARQDLFTLQDAKRGRQTEINKLYSENPREAEKQAFEFNKTQIKKIAEISKKMGIEGTPTKSILNKYIIDKVKGKKVSDGTDIREMFKKQKNQKRKKVLSTEQQARVDKIIKDSFGG